MLPQLTCEKLKQLMLNIGVCHFLSGNDQALSLKKKILQYMIVEGSGGLETICR